MEKPDGEHSEQFPTKCTHMGKDPNSSCAVCLKVKKLNGNIVKARRTVDSAVEQLHIYLEEVNRVYDPIQRLPVELVCSIFFLCFPRFPSLDIFDVSHVAMADHALRPIPLFLGSICRYWRRVVWSSPQFWNILWLHVTPHTTMTRSRMLTEWLTKSGQLPLYVCMFTPRKDDIQRPYDNSSMATARNSINYMIDTLTCYTGRIKVLHLRLDPSYISQFGRKNVFAAKNIMESLFIEGYANWFHSQYDYLSQSMFKLLQKPSPTRVSLVGVGFRQISIHWENVTFVEVPECRLGDVLEILRLATQLRHFKFGTNSCDHELDRYPPVTHLTLKTLDIIDLFDPNFFEHIICPALENFSYFELDASTAVFLVAFFNRSACPLKRLAIPGEIITDLVFVLRATPLLTHLSLEGRRSLNCTLLCINFIHTLCSQERSGSPPIEELILRNLCSLSLSIHLVGSCMHWIPPIISRLRSVVSPQKKNLPQIRVEVVLSAYVANNWNSGENVGHYVIDHDSLIRIMELGLGGVEIEVIDLEGLDLILLSQHFHEMF